MLSHLTILLLQCADLSLYLGVRLLYFAILPLHSSVLQFRHWEKHYAVVICHFRGVRFSIVFCLGIVQFGMTLRNDFRTR